MATTYCGAVSLADVFPGVVSIITPLRATMVSLRTAASVALGAVAEARAKVDAAAELLVGLEANLSVSVGGQLDALLAFKVAIRLLALADLELQLQAALALEASLSASISDPTAYLAGLIQAAASLQIDIGALVPTVTLAAQLDAALALKVEVGAKIAAFDLALSVVLQIRATLQAAIDAAAAASLAARAVLTAAVAALASLAGLQAQIDATLAPLDAALALEASLSAGPVEVYRYDGLLSGLGASVDASVTANSALGGAAGVRLWVVVAPDANVAAKTTLSTLLKTTP